MKTLYLVRHAEAGYDSENHSDLRRKLTERGLKSAKKIGHYLKNYLESQETSIDQITASMALRTATTAQLIAQELTYDLSKIQLELSLYETDVMRLLHFLNTQDDAINSLLIVNHNPTITEFVRYLTGENLPAMKPATLVELKFEIPTWKMVSGGMADLVYRENF